LGPAAIGFGHVQTTELLINDPSFQPSICFQLFPEPRILNPLYLSSNETSSITDSAPASSSVAAAAATAVSAATAISATTATATATSVTAAATATAAAAAAAATAIAAAAATAAAIAAAAAATAILGARERLVHVEGSAFDLFPVQAGDGRLSFFFRGHLNEPEPLGLTRAPVFYDRNGFNRPECGERLPQVLFGNFVRQVACIDFHTDLLFIIYGGYCWKR
jgi:hypothetical protein